MVKSGMRVDKFEFESTTGVDGGSPSSPAGRVTFLYKDRPSWFFGMPSNVRDSSDKQL